MNNTENFYAELMRALTLRDIQKVTQLLEDGANPNKRFNGQPVFWYVFPHIESNAALALSRKEEPITTEINRLLKLLIKYGASFDATDVEWSACFNGSFALNHYIPIQELMSLGADVSRKSIKRTTALHILVHKESRHNTDGLEELDAILDAGVDINALDLSDESAFSSLCHSYLKARHKRYLNLTSYENMLKALTARGADIDIPAKKKIVKNGDLILDVKYKNGEFVFNMVPAISELPEDLQKELREIQRYEQMLIEQQEEDIEIYAR